MASLKNLKADLRTKYKRIYEISLIVSLAALIAAFKYFPHIKPVREIQQTKQDVFQLVDVQQTVQIKRPPPPPRPAIPISAPSSEILDNVDFASTELNVNAKISAPPPPPKKENLKESKIIFIAVEEMPEPLGGLAAIQSKIVYPEIAKKAGIEGKVFVTAIIDKNGNVINASILKGIGAGCDEAALKAVEETKFKPGKQRGQPVNVKMYVPVVFKLQ